MIADLIRQYCANNNLTYRQFANKIGTSRDTVAWWINNNSLPKRNKNKTALMKRMAELFGCEVSQLNTYVLPPKSEPPKRLYNYRCLDDIYEPDCLHCVWHKDCGDDIVYCAKPGALCVNARR